MISRILEKEKKRLEHELRRNTRQGDPRARELAKELKEIKRKIKNNCKSGRQSAQIPQTEQRQSAQIPRIEHCKHILFEHLLRFNFGEQVRLAKQIIEEHRAAAFLIHGRPNYGQQVLAYRLARLNPEWETAEHLIIAVSSNGIGKSSQALWGQVARKLQMPFRTEPRKIVAKVGEWLRTKNVIITIHKIDYMPVSILSDWIEEFWRPMVSITRNEISQLLLFMVDNEGEVCNSDLPLAQCAQKDHMPVLLPAIEPFPENAIKVLIDNIVEVLPHSLCVETLINATCNGIPNLVYDEICQHCGFSWEGDIARWH